MSFIFAMLIEFFSTVSTPVSAVTVPIQKPRLKTVKSDKALRAIYDYDTTLLNALINWISRYIPHEEPSETQKIKRNSP